MIQRRKNPGPMQRGTHISQPANEFAVYTIVSLPINDVQPDPLQPRKSLQAVDGEVAPEDHEALVSLAEDIHQKGQLQPIVVKEIKDRKYQIIMGERRWRAAKLNQKRYPSDAGTVLAVIRDDIADENLRLAQLSENLQRVDLSDLETATFLKNILGEYPSLKKQTLASILGKNPQYVSRILAIVDPQWSHVIATGIITYASLLEQFRALPQEAQTALIESSKKRGEALTSGDINRARAEVKNKRQAKASIDVSASTKNPSELKVSEQNVDSAQGLSLQTLAEVSAFLQQDLESAGEAYQYPGKVERLMPDTASTTDYGGKVAIPAGTKALNPNLLDKREVKLTIGQLHTLLIKQAFTAADFVVTAMIPVDEVKTAISRLGGELPADDNQLVLSLIKQLNEVSLK